MKATILQGDVRDRLRELPDESVHCCVTSPPYWGLRDYGIPSSTWPDGWVGCFGLEPTPEMYVGHAVLIFREVRRVLRKDGTLWMNLGDCYATGAGKVGECPGGGEQGARWAGDVDRLRDDKRGYHGERLANGDGDQPAILRKKTRADRDGSNSGKHTAIAAIGPMTQPNRMPLPGLKPKDMVGAPWRVAFALQSDGWYLRQDIVWHKPNPMPESVRDRCTKSHEYIFLMAKSERYYYDNEAIREPITAPEASTPDDLVRAHNRRRETSPEQRQGKIKVPGGWDLGPGAHGTIHRGGRTAATYIPKQDMVGNRTYTGFNGRWDAAENAGDVPDTRNKRSVWTIDEDEYAQFLEWKAEHAGGKRDVWTVATSPFPEAHFATFPPDLIEPCILAGCPEGGIVLDTFNGSGTTGMVALRLRREYIGIDIKPEYVEMSERRITNDAPLLNSVEVRA